jgi:hypothetical protein
MSGAMREKDSSDYDLERLTELFDEALTSDDPRVKNALRQLMMMVILTSDEHEDKDRGLNGRRGPMRRMQEDLNDLRRIVSDLRHEIQNLQKMNAWSDRASGGYRGGAEQAARWPQTQSTGTNAISAEDYWKSQAAAKYSAQISEDALRELDIRVNSAAEGLFKK